MPLSKAAQKKIDDALLDLEKETGNILIKHAADAAIVGEVAAQKAVFGKVSWNQVDKAALKIMESYTREIVRGGSTCAVLKPDGSRVPEFVPWLKDTSSENQNKLTDLIEAAIKNGQGLGRKEGSLGYQPGSLGEALSTMFDERKSHATMVARTEMNKIRNDAAFTRYRDAGVEEVEVVGSDVNPCEECEELRGVVYKITDAPYLPIHPNCVLPGTRYKPLGDLISGLRARYDGEAIKFTFANGADLSVTPNHMLLTPHGFAAAHLLREGDDVLYSPGSEGVISQDPNNDGDPARIENIISALSETTGMRAACVPVSPEDLHGDARFVNGDIDVIRPDSLLRGANKPLGSECIETDAFNGADIGGLNFFGGSSLAEILKRLARAADSSMGSSRVSAPFFASKLAGPEEGSITATSRLDAGTRQPARDQTIRDPQVGSNIGESLPPEISSTYFLRINPPAPVRGEPHFDQSSVDNRGTFPEVLGDIIERESLCVQTTEIVRIDHMFYHGYIYDVQTLSTLCLYNSIITSNCTDTLVPVIQVPGENSEASA